MITDRFDNLEPPYTSSASDSESFEIIYRLNWKGLCIYAFRITGSISVAKDIVQDVFVSFLERNNELEIGNIKGYLWQSVRFKCLNWLRNNNIRKDHISRMMSVIQTSNVESSINLNHINESVKVAISLMSPRCREIYILSRYKFSSNKEISEKLNIDIRTVENQLSNALRIIKSRIKY